MTDSNYRPRMSFYAITEAMFVYGGSFIQNLARTLRAADETNRRKLVLCFQEEWQRYDELAILHEKKTAGASHAD